MDRLFLDANVLFSAAYQPSNPLLVLWQLADTDFLASPWVIQEAENALGRARPARLPDLAALLASVFRVPDAPIGTPLPAGIQLPDKDQPVLLAALQAQASHLLTGDLKHFGPYFGLAVAGLVILRPAVYLQGRQVP